MRDGALKWAGTCCMCMWHGRVRVCDASVLDRGRAPVPVGRGSARDGQTGSVVGAGAGSYY
eukprot:668287-Prymnesium_polylepis.1